MSTIKAVQTAFRPGRETTDPERFAGRRSQIEKGCRLLLARDHVFLYGVRGIGKSSLARQLELIASGDTRLLAKLESDYANETFEFATAFLTRDDSIRNVNHLLYRLMIDEPALKQWDASPLQSYELEGALNPELVSEFMRRVRHIASFTRDGVAIFIDEFERIPDRLGFASLIKAAPDKCLFVVTGVGKTEKDLVQDHESIIRQLNTGKLLVDTMAEDELRSVIATAEHEVADILSIDEAARARLVEICDGHPYLLHLVGQASLVRSFRDRKRAVTTESIETALRDIATGNHETFLEERYLKAIGNSPQREMVLRVFAESDSDPVPTQAAYPVAKLRGVGNPSYYVGDLQKEQFGQELEKVSDQYYRIADPLFKAYVRATPTRLSARFDDIELEETSPQPDFVLLHMSDVHYGPTHFFTNLAINQDTVPEADRLSLERSLLRALEAQDFPLRPDIVVVSGDLTQTGSSHEFALAKKMISAVTGHIESRDNLHNGSTRLLLVPGNHDVNWGIATADPGNKGMPFAPYIQFARDLGADFELGLPPERLFLVHDFRPEFPLLVAALNSNVLEGPNDHRGYIGESQMEAALAEFARLDPDAECLRVAVFHHHLVPVSSLEATLDEPGHTIRDAARAKAALLDAGVALVMHGHRHHAHEEALSDGKNHLVIIGSGSTGVLRKERGEQPLQLSQIKVRCSRKIYSVIVERFVFDVTRGRWLPQAGASREFSIPRPRVGAGR